MLLTWLKLRKKGILGMNQRNIEYISEYNKRSLYYLVDDKREIKKRALSSGIAVPKLYSVIEIEHQITKVSQLIANLNSFVIKPAHGSGGNGILVIQKKINRDCFIKANEATLTLSELCHHISNILSGMYSLSGVPDVAMIEYCVSVDDTLSQLSYKGVPDIRTIVFRGIPITAMIRLPTRKSMGRANLHQGAVGVGLNIKNGMTKATGVYFDKLITSHPDNGTPFAEIQIPFWGKILTLAAECQKLVSLDYLGVDIVLDKKYGPMVLELNARPGLSIQTCNQQGLITQLKKITNITNIPKNIAERVQIGKSLAQ